MSRMPTEFRIRSVGNGDWIVYWWGCDSRSVARCFNRYEASQIAKALNETGAAVRWYARAQTARSLHEAHYDEPAAEPPVKENET